MTGAGGALLAVCGLCGGAGASTLSLLVARDAGEREGPVLLCDLGGPSGGLSLYAGVQAPRSLPAAANLVAAGKPLVGGMFAAGDVGLRVLAGGPEPDSAADAAGLERLLGDARRAHPLTVVDCGTVRTATERAVLAAATHVAWVVPATLGGVRRARRTLEVFGIDRERGEAVVARHDAGGRAAPTEELAALAHTRAAPLVLMPHVPDLGEEDVEGALEAAALTLESLRGVIRR